MLVPGETAGWLLQLGRARAADRAGRRHRRACARAGPSACTRPVGYGDLLVELAPLETAGAELAHDVAEKAAEEAGSLVLRSPTAGRFWHRSAPSDPPLVEPGATLEEGTAVGLVEVMKTFAQVLYRSGSGLPRRARVVRLVAADGADVDEGDALLEVEPG